MKPIYIFSIAAMIFCTPGYCQTAWHANTITVSFKIKNAGLTVNGSFDTASCNLSFDPNKLSDSKLSGKVIVNSIRTGINKRDKDIKKEDYFDIDHYKDIEIRSKKLYYKNAQYAGLFDVTIKGITKEVEIPFEFNPFADEAEFKGTFTIDRIDFKVGGNSMIMGDNVTVIIDIKAKK